MSLPTRIELHAGADRNLRIGLWLVWLAATLALFSYLPRIDDGMALLGIAVLWWSFPARLNPGLEGSRLILHADGLAQWGEEQGVWLPDSWRTRWYNVIQFQSATCRHFIWISAGNNHAADYRHLGLWWRFPPQQTAASANDSHLLK